MSTKDDLELHPSQRQVTVFDQSEDERRGLLERLRKRRRERAERVTVEDMGGPEPTPLVAGRFAGVDLSLSAYLNGGVSDRVMPGHEAGAVERARRGVEHDSAGASVQRSPFAPPATEEPVLGIGVQRSPFV